MQAGRSRQTPAAVISHATTEAQEICEGTLENLADRVEEAKLTSPALIIVGDVVALRRQLHFFEEKPLWGKHYLVAKLVQNLHVWPPCSGQRGHIPVSV